MTPAVFSIGKGKTGFKDPQQKHILYDHIRANDFPEVCSLLKVNAELWES